jgi:hypothetical protein
MADSEEISFEASYATGQTVFVPVALMPILILTFLGVWGPFIALTFLGISQNFLLYVVLSFVVLIPSIVFFYGSPWKKLGKMHDPPKLIVANEIFPEEDDRMKPSIGTRTRQNLKKEKEVVHAIEDKIHLAKMLRFIFDEVEVAAYLQENPLGQTVVVWAFECPGIPYSLSQDQYNEIAKKVEAGISDFSATGTAETLTFDAEVRSDCSGQLAATQLMRDAEGLQPEDLFVLDGIDDRSRALARDGRIAPRSLRIYATTNLSEMISPEEMELGDRIQFSLEKKLAFLKPVDDVEKELRDQLILAYEQGFKKWRRLLENKLELSVHTFSLKQAWQNAWNEVNDGSAPIPNHVITISEKGMKVHKSGDTRLLASLLFQNGVPTLAKDFVYLPARNQYLAICVMAKFPNRLWFSNERKAQLAYGSAAINNPSALNTRILVQLSTVPPSQAKFASNWKVKTEASTKDWRQKRRIVDADSDVMMEDAITSARSRKKGAVDIKWAWVAMVYRPSKSQLEDAIASLTEHSSFSGNIVLRERCYCDQIWLTSMPSLSAHKILQKAVKPETLFSSFERRLTNKMSAVVGVLPIMKEHPLHRKGYQLVTRLKEPIFIDPLCKESYDGQKDHINYIVLGEKGSGKSKFVQGMGKNAMMQGARLIIIDGARTDGSGSFDEWARYEPNAAYFNPNRDASNIFDAVDQRFMAPFNPEDPLSLDIWGGIENFLVQSLTELSYQGTNPELTPKFKEVHSYFVGEFYRNPEIRALRNAAFDAGIGSAGWDGVRDEATPSGLKERLFGFCKTPLSSSMPTLRHYLGFLDIANLPEDAKEYVDPLILKQAKGAIYALLQQQLGRAIARPTNVDFNKAQLIVYAMSAIAEEDMLPLGIAMTGSILFQTNKPGLKSLIFEEAAINLRHKVLALTVAEAWAQGRKKDQHCIIVSQDIQPIVESSAGNDVLKNSPVVVVGAIVSAAVQGISTACKVSEEVVARCAEASFMPKNDEFGRNFLVSSKGGHLFATDYPDFRSLFMVMNEADERALKAQMKEEYPDNKYKRIEAGAKILRAQSIHKAGDAAEAARRAQSIYGGGR